MRRSEDIVSIWEEILIDTQADLGEERWMILEQVRLVCQMILIMRNEIIYPGIDMDSISPMFN